jgi:hypothetical protein
VIGVEEGAMRDTMLTVRLPFETRAAIRALSAVTGLSVQEVVLEAFDRYYSRLPRGVRQQVNDITDGRRRSRA